MNLSEYIDSPQKRELLARAVGSAPGYLWQIETAWRGKKPSPAFARRIESATNGAVTRYELRPDVFGTAPDIKAAEKAA